MSMVKQTRTIFSPQDLMQMRIRCGSCSGELTFPIERQPQLPTECPHCLGHWWSGWRSGNNSAATRYAISLAEAVHYFLRPGNADDIAAVKFGVQLEIDGDSDEEAG